MKTLTNRTRRVSGVVIASCIAIASMGCSDDPDPVGTDDFESMLLILETPGTDEGALLLTIEGPGSATVETLSSAQTVFSEEVDDGALRVALVGNLAAGAVLLVRTPDGRGEEYVADLEQVAGRNNQLRSNLSAYELTLQSTDD